MDSHITLPSELRPVLVRLLGPVEIAGEDGWQRGGAPKQACVLACLALSPGTAVSIETLAHRVWDGPHPTETRNIIYGHVTRLRQLLKPHDEVRLRRMGTSEYQLDIEPELVDAWRMRDLAGKARAVQAGGDMTTAAELWRGAVEQWRGPALAGIKTEWSARTSRRLRNDYLAAAAGWSECLLQLGQHEAVVGNLEPIVEHHPLVENLVAPLLLALYRCGRTMDALNRYTDTRRQLRKTLGNDPGERLRTLYQRILRQEPELLRAPATERREAAPAAVSPAPAPVPAQLPARVSGFINREAQLETLDAQLPSASLVTISGMAGVGKTALAVHWAQRIASRFPDGQLYVNLRGFDPSGQPTEPADVIRGFLDALAVPPHSIPVSPDAQIGLYRSLVADRKMLILLDNAGEEKQVRDLLPGTPECLTIVTSRNRLTGLTASHGAVPMPLSEFTPEESRRFLRSRLGEGQLAAEPQAADTIIATCAGLPLALAVVAARAATMPQVQLEQSAAELRGATGDLEPFVMSDVSTDIRAVFSWSYRLLGAEAAHFFILLGHHPGPDISTAAAASLAGVPLPRARALLGELLRVHLVTERRPGRFVCHDLLRSYASELDTLAEWEGLREGLRRVVDHYTHTAHAAARLVHPMHDLPPEPSRCPGVTPEKPADRQAAMAWLRTEHEALLASMELSIADGWDSRTLRIAAAMLICLDLHGMWGVMVATQEKALAAAQRLGDPRAIAGVHRDLSRAYSRLGRFDEAEQRITEALRQFEQLGDLGGQARVQHQASVLNAMRGRHREALTAATRAVELGELAGDLVAQAIGHNAIGWHLSQLGDQSEALSHCQRAMVLADKIGYQQIKGGIWDSLGHIHRRRGCLDQAMHCFRRAVDDELAIGNRLGFASALVGCGDVRFLQGETDAARETWQRALSILEALKHPDAERVRGRLAGRLDPSGD
ncbi:AfsR/SARP family transcriptional regulator [Stackebrandtia nassauensis]|nr:BTAD domain-containing putative transcriptional regulator [Stackebrandtia nassauensis]